MLPSIVLFAGLINLVSGAAVNDIRPLVIWHGLGDTYSSPGMVRFQKEVKEMHPSIFVHSIFIDEDTSADQRAGFVSVHARHVCFDLYPSVWECERTNRPSCPAAR